jgi:4-amino-4-deoxy-L-arabinose transferase-like glycosyltransferase
MPISISERFGGALTGFADGLCDPARRQRYALGFCAVYAAAWALYGVIAKSSQDINTDMAEMVMWSREPAFGYPRHPPLLAWVLALWFKVFPVADWSYYLLAAVTVAAGLYFAFVLAGEWLEGEKRALAPLLLTLVPFYNFLGLKFDQNSALIPLWALTTWAFARSLRTRQSFMAVIAGLAAAAAMLTKYWSAFLLAGLAIAALTSRERTAYFRSPAPYITMAVGAIAISPHIVWLFQADFITLAWARSRVTVSMSDVLRSLSEYVGGSIGYGAGAIIAVMLLRPSLDWQREAFFPSEPWRRTAAIMYWLPPLIPIVFALSLGINLLSLWIAPAYSLLPVLLLSPALINVPRPAVAAMAAVSAIVALIALLIAPAVAAWKLTNGVENDAAYGRLLAAEVDRTWRRASDRPLKLIGGRFYLAYTTAFYAADRPVTFADFSQRFSPLVDDKRIAHEGMAMVCPAEDKECLEAMTEYRKRAPDGPAIEVELARHWLGLAGPPQRFIIATLPPQP